MGKPIPDLEGRFPNGLIVLQEPPLSPHLDRKSHIIAFTTTNAINLIK